MCIRDRFFTAFGLIGGIASILYGVIALKRGGIAEHEIVTETTDESRWNSASDPAEELKKLKSLYDDGILSLSLIHISQKPALSISIRCWKKRKKRDAAVAAVRKKQRNNPCQRHKVEIRNQSSLPLWSLIFLSLTGAAEAGQLMKSV